MKNKLTQVGSDKLILESILVRLESEKKSD